MQPASAEELLKGFQHLDKENKGYLTKEFLCNAMVEYGEPFTQDELNEMMAVAVEPQSGHINYEFYINQIMVRQKKYKSLFLLIDKFLNTEKFAWIWYKIVL